MRVDKFLKVSRLVKRRTVAKEMCNRGQVRLNGRVIKAGAVIEPGNIIEINFGRRRLKVEVCMLKETVPARMVSEMYRVIEERKITSEEDHL